VERLSFLYHPIEHLCNSIPQLFPQCKKYSACWTNRIGQTIISHISDKSSLQHLVQPGDKEIQSLLPFRQSDKRKQWITEDEDPLQVRNSTIVQLDLSKELERNILLLTFSSPFTNLRDVILLYLDSSISQFGITRNNRGLRQEDRMIISSLIVQACDTLISIQSQDQQLFAPLSTMKSHLQHEMQTLQNELDNKDRTLAKGLEDYTDHILEKLAKRFKIEIKLTKRAYDKIGQFDGKFADLELSLQESVSIAVNSCIIWENEIILDESDLFLRKELATNKEVLKDSSPAVGRLTKTHQLLDKYEEAARQAQRGGDPIIGRIIGNYCNPSISNAAITDSLNNHKDRIWELMAKYPEKWPIIRNNFRSIINLITKFEQKLLEQEQNAS